MATLLYFIILLSLTVGICTSNGKFCDDDDCEFECCSGHCCRDTSRYSSSINSEAIVGIIIAWVVFTVSMCMCGCCFLRRRRQTAIIQHGNSPQTSVTVNSYHTGYDQPRPKSNATPMPGHMPGPMPNAQYTQQMGPVAPPN